jgi:chromosomal replication initiation ATPase DnaA
MTDDSKHTPAQLVLELPHLEALGAEDFFISSSNARAASLIDAWPRWPQPSAVLCGPQGAGKSHLANIWRSRSGAALVVAAELSEDDLSRFERHRALVVEDIHEGIAEERLLFHALNLAREKAYSVLLTSRAAPGELSVSLPDLRSRLRAVPLVTIESPDEALIKAVLIKLFADRQLMVEPHVVSYLALHMERSLDAANRVVRAADRLALARQRRVSRALAAEALEAAISTGSRE